MSEISEMIEDGTLCQVCGCLMINEDEEPCGYPISCDDCEEEDE